MPHFQRYIGIDYSGAETAEARLKALQPIVKDIGDIKDIKDGREGRERRALAVSAAGI